MTESDFLKVARQAALEAGKVIKQYSGKKLRKNEKNRDSSDFATEADVASEKVIVEIIQKKFPDHNIIAEEKNRIDQGSEYTWVIDPLDGTISFAGGLPYVSILIGLLKNNQPILGVIYNVMEKNIYVAQLGKGSYLNGKRIRVSKKNNLAEALVDMDLGHKSARKEKFQSYVLPLMDKVAYIYSTGAAIPMTSTAKGNLEAYISQAWIWDHLAGALLVMEAGGKVTDFQGKDPDWNRDRLALIFSNGLIHDQILEVLKK